MTAYWVQLPLEGPVQSRLCLGDWPRLSQHLASRLWVDAQKNATDAHFRNTKMRHSVLTLALKSREAS